MASSNTRTLTAFWGLPFEDMAVIGPRGGKSKDWRWAAIFKEGGVAWRGSCTHSKAESAAPKGVSALPGGTGRHGTMGGSGYVNPGCLSVYLGTSLRQLTKL